MAGGRFDDDLDDCFDGLELGKVGPFTREPSLAGEGKGENKAGRWLKGYNCVYFDGKEGKPYRVALKTVKLDWWTAGFFADLETAAYVANVCIAAIPCKVPYVLNEVDSFDKEVFETWAKTREGGAIVHKASQVSKQAWESLSVLMDKLVVECSEPGVIGEGGELFEDWQSLKRTFASLDPEKLDFFNLQKLETAATAFRKDYDRIHALVLDAREREKRRVEEERRRAEEEMRKAQEARERNMKRAAKRAKPEIAKDPVKLEEYVRMFGECYDMPLNLLLKLSTKELEVLDTVFDTGWPHIHHVGKELGKRRRSGR